MKNLIYLLVISLMFISFPSSLFSQTSDSIPQKQLPQVNERVVSKMQKPVSLNVIGESQGALKVKSFKNIDISSSASEDVPDTSQLITLAIKANSGERERFNCSSPSATKPLFLSELNQVDDRVFDVTNNLDVNLSLFGIQGSLGKGKRLIQANFWLSKDAECEGPKTVKALVGMSLYLVVSDLKIKLPDFTLGSISAAASLNKAKVQYHLRYYGVTNLIDFKLVPTAGSLTTSSYNKVLANWEKILEKLDTKTIIDPVLIPNIIPMEYANL
jgi:hypothetical protein